MGPSSAFPACVAHAPAAIAPRPELEFESDSNPSPWRPLPTVSWAPKPPLNASPRAPTAAVRPPLSPAFSVGLRPPPSP
ncbi:hypothetical protein U9M48_013034 [Paspalum notatum var. saurae]|uniref:Uncharacterized protein n=1 Tax=Paspalum notatum var. saurae TaxID=547442 RepID=A0AAQ3T1H9_PASNO